MFKEIGPLPKFHWTSIIIALKYVNFSHSIRVSESVYLELSCWWNRFFNFDTVKVKFITLDDLYFRSKWYVFFYIFIYKFISEIEFLLLFSLWWSRMGSRWLWLLAFTKITMLLESLVSVIYRMCLFLSLRFFRYFILLNQYFFCLLRFLLKSLQVTCCCRFFELLHKEIRKIRQREWFNLEIRNL